MNDLLPNPSPALWLLEGNKEKINPANQKKDPYYSQSTIEELLKHIGEHERNFARYIVIQGAYIRKLEDALATVRIHSSSELHTDIIKLIDDALAAKPGDFAHCEP